MVKDKDDKVKCDFASVMSRFINKQNEQCIHEIAQLLQEKSWQIRYHAVRELGLVGSHIAIPYIERVKIVKDGFEDVIAEQKELALTHIYINNMNEDQKIRKLQSIALGTDVLQDEVSRTWAVTKLVEEGQPGTKEFLRGILNEKYKTGFSDQTSFTCTYGIYQLGGELTEEEKKILSYYHLID